MHFWVGVSALAGALRRKVWIDQAYFQWFPNFYIVLVAPPGIVSKSTTASVAMRLLRQVPNIKFGPDVVTWQALVGAFSDAAESFDYNGDMHTMSALTLESSEFGNLLNPQDKEMVDMLVTLWDGKTGAMEKRTKMSGNDTVVNPWINLVACTTPAWIAGNFPEYVIGGGFTSRCLFVYADKKEKYVAYPGMSVPPNLKQQEALLVQDLEQISMNIAGPYRMTREAIIWGQHWYTHHYEVASKVLADDRLGGYIARKQTHIHKLAMVVAAAQRDEAVITKDDLEFSNMMVTDLEVDMPRVFAQIGRSDLSIQTERFLAYVQKNGSVDYSEGYRFIHAYFPSAREFEDMIAGLVKANLIALVGNGGKIRIKALHPLAAMTGSKPAPT